MTRLQKTDPEYAAILERFQYGEAMQDPDVSLPPEWRCPAILAALLGCGGVDAFREALPGFLEQGLSPVAIKEIVYQGTDYLGYGRVLPFLHAANEVFAAHGIPLPLPGQATVTPQNRLEEGVAVQTALFGDRMRTAWQAGTVNRFLAQNCFGDYDPRNGLSLRVRELVTFCFLAALGGCDPQLAAHAKGNLHIGNDADLLSRAVLCCLPYIGYPRTLNALACIREAQNA